MLLWCLTGYYCHPVIKPNQENYPGFGVVFWLLISSVKIFTSWDCKFFRWEFHGRFWNDVSCTFQYLQMVGGQINLPEEFFAKLYHFISQSFQSEEVSPMVRLVASREPCDIMKFALLTLANEKSKKTWGWGVYPIMGIRNSLLPRLFFLNSSFRLRYGCWISLWDLKRFLHCIG